MWKSLHAHDDHDHDHDRHGYDCFQKRFLIRNAMIQSNNRILLGVLAFLSFTFVIFCTAAFWGNTAEPRVQVSPSQFYGALQPKCPVVECPTLHAVTAPMTDGGNQGNITSAVEVKCPEDTRTILDIAYNRKYIGCNFWATGGIGNQIWRFASIYGIGRFTGREPFFESKNTDQMKHLMEIAEVFPMMHEVLQVKSPPESFIKKYHFADDCCKFDDPKKLLNVEDKYVKVAGDYMQSYKFFHDYRDEIRRIFECGLTVRLKVDDFMRGVFKNDTSLKLCAHVRRGDFIGDLMLESKEDFTVPALQFALNHLRANSTQTVSLLFIGNDDAFVKSLPIQTMGFYKIYTPPARSRGEDMCTGILHCDAMLMTASGSTFGWWISYLMKPEAPIFYNSQITDNADFTKDVHDFDIFPPDWHMLTVKDGKAEKETKWWHQRRGLPPDLPPPGMPEWV